MKNRTDDDKTISTKSDGTLNKNKCVDALCQINSGIIHDLRQPLQTMSLLHSVLKAKISDAAILQVVARLEEARNSMSNILNASFTSCKQVIRNEGQSSSTPEKHSIIKNKTRSSSITENLQLPVIYIVDDDKAVCDAMADLLIDHAKSVELFSNCEKFLESYKSGSDGFLIIDALLPNMSGLELLKLLRGRGDSLPAIMITGYGDVSLAVQALRVGASDFIEKPIGYNELIASITRVIQQYKNRDLHNASANREVMAARISRLSSREKQIMDKVLDGHPNKIIAADLDISQRTVEAHRASIMKKTGSKSLSELIKLALAAAG